MENPPFNSWKVQTKMQSYLSCDLEDFEQVQKKKRILN